MASDRDVLGGSLGALGDSVTSYSCRHKRAGLFFSQTDAGGKLEGTCQLPAPRQTGTFS